MDAIAEYLIKSEDFSKILATLLKENVVDKIIGAQLRVDKKSGIVDRFTVQPKLVEKEEDLSDFPLSPLIAFGYARTDSASKFLHKSVAGAMNEKVGLIARPCDTRALIELAKIRQVNMDNLFIIGIEDRGMFPKAGKEMRSVKDVDPTKITKEKVGDAGLIVKMEDGSTQELKLSIAENCLRCYRKIPVVADLTVSDLGIPIDSDEIILKVYSDKGSDLLEKSGVNKTALSAEVKSAHTKKFNEIIEKAKEKRVKDLEGWDKLSQEEKIVELLKCTACGTCIRGCPVCYCVDCILTKKKKAKTIDNVTYQLTRIAHDADRCIECGNCDNNCPQNLPLSLYFQSLNEAFKEKFNYEAGMSLEDTPFRSGKAISEMELEKT
ncbi:MAG: Coenzyme F420 hydrogenase/dehydrogenase, beta subunit C-terminal domain [Candidatus Lokiarchaeota archaeon]|nr:Coenzyme F420 hydrogenase/dehydrogenase, beta subunit C-terminal domain [Candidatus Lokiarchaeota archaeon]